MEQCLPWKSNISLAGQESPHILRNVFFIALFTRARQFSVSWEIQIISTSAHFMSTRSIIILYAYSWLDLQFRHSSSYYRTEIIYAFFLIPIRATWPFLPGVLDFIYLLACGKDYKVRSSSLSTFRYQDITFSLLCLSVFQVCNFRIFTSISGIAIWWNSANINPVAKST
jgi:hypothetical protein